MLWYASIGTELLPVTPKRRKNGAARYSVMSRSRRGMDSLVSKVCGERVATRLRVIRGGDQRIRVPAEPVKGEKQQEASARGVKRVQSVAATFASRNSSTFCATSSCCETVICGNIGSDTISAATRSVTGNAPCRYPRC